MKPCASRLLRLAASICFLGGALNTPALTRYVSLSGGAIPPYTNWAGAARTIQDAVDVTQHGDVVLVDDGVYAAGSRVTPGGNLLNRVVITNDITVQSRNGPSKTIISGNRAPGTEPIRCVFISGNATLIGLTLTNGGTRATGVWPMDFCGGGLYFDENAGGGVFNCIIRGNKADSSRGEGGGVYLLNSYADIRDSVISDNEAGGGGGVRITGGNPTLLNLVIIRNRAAGAGGIQFYHSDCTVRNVLVAENTASVEGGGLYFDGCSPQLENLTVVGNRARAGLGGGLGVSYRSNPRLKNCIVWGNAQEQIAFNPQWYGMAVTIAYSAVEGGPAAIVTHGLGPVHWMQGNMDSNPLFVGAGDYALQAASPCINAGLNMGWMPGATDLSGNPRIAADRVDMGAYEFGEAPGASDWITKIGFSTRPDGDQDVTLFYRDETLWITVEDVGPNPNKPLSLVMATLSQRRNRRYINRTIRLKPAGPDRFVGFIPLSVFRQGEVSVAISGCGSGRVLYRLSAIIVQ